MPSGRQRLFFSSHLLYPKCLKQHWAYCIRQSHLLNVTASKFTAYFICQNQLLLYSFLPVWSIHLQLYIDKVKEKTTRGTLDLDGLAHRI